MKILTFALCCSLEWVSFLGGMVAFKNACYAVFTTKL